MKKIWILNFIMLLLYCITYKSLCTISAKDYTEYQEIILSKGKMLANFTDEELQKYYKEVEKTKFFGWNTFIINKKYKANFISDTIYSFYNTGTTAVDYDLNCVYETTSKTSISCTGSISYSFKGTSENKRFKNDLDAALKMEYSNVTTDNYKQTEKMTIKIDPNTKLIIYISGSGTVLNGVGAYYIFWIRSELGGFEYFTVTDEYPRIEKISI